MPPYNTRDIPRHYVVSLYFKEDRPPPPHHVIERMLRAELETAFPVELRSAFIVPATPSALEPFLKKLANERDRKR